MEDSFDVQYLNAIRSGDVESALSILRTVASNYGFLKDADGKAIIVYRGEHGNPELSDEMFQSRLGSISFGSERAARHYSVSPNNSYDVPVSPRVIPAFIRIKNPLPIDPQDPFMDVSTIRDVSGLDGVRYALGTFSEFIERTSHWEENFSDEFNSPLDVLALSPELADTLYVDIFPVLDSHFMVTLMKEHGYDGAIYGGCGDTALETEYRIFDPCQAVSAEVVVGDKNMSMFLPSSRFGEEKERYAEEFFR